MMKRLTFAIMALILCSTIFAQDKLLTANDLMNGSLYPSRVRSVQFIGKSNRFAFVRDNVLYSGTSSSQKEIVNLETLNKAFNSLESTELRYFPNVSFVNDKEFRFTMSNTIYLYNIKTKSLSKIATYDKAGENVDFEGRNYQVAYTKGDSLFVNSRQQVFTVGEGGDGIVFGQSVHRSEFGIEKGTFWSPQGNLLAFYRMDESMVTDYPMVNTATRITTATPIKYPMAGMKSHEVTVGIFNTLKGTTIYLDTRRDTTVAEREMYLTNLSWSPDEKTLFIAKINREQNHTWLESYDVETGKLKKVLFEEKNERYTEPVDGLYFLPTKPNQFLWLSYRDGYKHIYLYNTDGSLVKQVTKGDYEVQNIIGTDQNGKCVFFYSNIENPAERAAYSVEIESGKVTRLTPDHGTHTIIPNSNGSYFLDCYSNTDVPFNVGVVNNKGKKMADIYTAPNPLADYAMPEIEMGTIKAADGKTDLCYRLIKPLNYDNGQKYPTLVYVYGGPHSQLVTDSWLGGGNLYFLRLAQQGYVVFTVDNRGTDNRGFEFESCTHRRLGEIEMADQMEGVKFLQSLPYVDKDRMGVEGWSFGGFMTITMKLAHPEIFKVACAGGPVIDWKWYEVMYGERYMDTPQENPDGYADNSLVRKAKKLEGKLLVIHGAEDPTVVWQNSLEFIDACIKAGKQVDYFVYPHHPHNVGGRDRLHLYQKMFQYYEDFLK